MSAMFHDVQLVSSAAHEPTVWMRNHVAAITQTMTGQGWRACRHLGSTDLLFATAGSPRRAACRLCIDALMAGLPLVCERCGDPAVAYLSTLADPITAVTSMLCGGCYGREVAA